MNAIEEAMMDAHAWLQGSIKQDSQHNFDHPNGYTCVPTSSGHIGAIFYPRKEKDKYQNDVTIIELPDLRKYRMVHHMPESKWRYQRLTVYAGRGKFFKITLRFSENDCKANVAEVHDFFISWGDGDNLGVYRVDNAPHRPEDANIIAALQDVTEDNWEQCVLMVILWLEQNDDRWLRKDVQPAA